MYEFLQTNTGWIVFWGPPQPVLKLVTDATVTEERETAEEVMAPRRVTERRTVRRTATRRELVAVR